MNKAIFFDRDGVINRDNGYVYKPEDFYFHDGIFDLCRKIQDKDYKLIVITNQSGIARGYYTEADFSALTDWMLVRFREEYIYITKVYYCPYHPVHGIGKYKKDSFDRKPNPGMIQRACDEYDIDLTHSVLIGDKDSDIDAGRNAGVGKLFALQGNYELSRANDVYWVKTLSEVWDILCAI